MTNLVSRVFLSQVHDYFATGADTNTTLHDNRQAYQRLRIVPRVMVNVANIDLTYKLLGAHFLLPLLISDKASLIATFA